MIRTARLSVVGLALFVLAWPTALFSAPFTLHPGDVLVADSGTYEDNFVARILRIDAAGSVTVLGSSANSLLKNPAAVYQDGDHALLIADQAATADHGAILSLDLGTGAITSLLSGPGLSGVSSIDFESASSFVVTDPLAFGGGMPGAVYRIDRSGSPRVVLANGPAGATYAWRTAREPGGTYLLLGQNGQAIRRLDPVAGTAPAWVIDPRLNGLQDMKRAPDGTVYTVSDGSPSRLAKIAPDGAVTILSEGGLLNRPFSVVLLSGGDLLAANYGDGSIVRVNGTTGAQSSFLPPGTVFLPLGMTVVESFAVPATPATWGKIKAGYR